MTQSTTLARFMEEHGNCTLDDIHPHWPNKTRAQLTTTLHNAAEAGHIRLVSAGGSGKQAVWGRALPPQPPQRVVSFVFDLGRAR